MPVANQQPRIGYSPIDFLFGGQCLNTRATLSGTEEKSRVALPTLPIIGMRPTTPYFLVAVSNVSQDFAYRRSSSGAVMSAVTARCGIRTRNNDSAAICSRLRATEIYEASLASKRDATVISLRPASWAMHTTSAIGRPRSEARFTSIGKVDASQYLNACLLHDRYCEIGGRAAEHVGQHDDTVAVSQALALSRISARRLSMSSSAPMQTADIHCCGPTTCSNAAINSRARLPWVTSTMPIIRSLNPAPPASPAIRRLLDSVKGRHPPQKVSGWLLAVIKAWRAQNCSPSVAALLPISLPLLLRPPLPRRHAPMPLPPALRAAASRLSLGWPFPTNPIL